MSDLNRALGEIGAIRQQVARSTEFRGYGPATLAATSLIAMGAAWVQWFAIPDAAAHFPIYLTLWISTAVICATLIGFQTITRTHRIHSGLADEMLWMAIEQFLPSIVAGILITLVIAGSAPAVAWMLPGLWQVIYSLGVFSSCRFLPKPMITAGAWFLLSGLACLALADSRALSPAAMGVPFGIGQFIVAGILYRQAGERHVEEV